METGVESRCVAPEAYQVRSNIILKPLTEVARIGDSAWRPRPHQPRPCFPGRRSLARSGDARSGGTNWPAVALGLLSPLLCTPQELPGMVSPGFIGSLITCHGVWSVSPPPPARRRPCPTPKDNFSSSGGVQG